MGIRGLSPPPRHERLGSPRWRTRAFSVCVLVSCLPPCVGLKTEEEQSREPTQPARRPHASASTYVLSIPTYVHFNRLEQLFDPVNTLLLARSPVLAGGPSFFWSADTPIGQPEMRPRIHDGPTAAWGRQTISQPPATRRGGTPRTPFTGPLAQRTGRARPRRPTSHTSAPFAAAERVLRAHPIGLAGTNRAAAARSSGGVGGRVVADPAWEEHELATDPEAVEGRPRLHTAARLVRMCCQAGEETGAETGCRARSARWACLAGPRFGTSPRCDAVARPPSPPPVSTTPSETLSLSQGHDAPHRLHGCARLNPRGPPLLPLGCGSWLCRPAIDGAGDTRPVLFTSERFRPLLLDFGFLSVCVRPVLPHG